MIYDAFPFFNELDLLEIRLNEMNDLVDYFVLAEAPITFSNNPKPIFYNDNKERFEKWNDKIIHIIVNDMPSGGGPWLKENFQRNALIRGLVNAKDDDWILLSDLDEIPRPEEINANTVFVQNLYGYYINVRSSSLYTTGTVCVTKKELDNYLVLQQLRANRGKYCVVEDGGWHFSYLGTPEDIVYKLNSSAHVEHGGKSLEFIESCFKDLKSPYSEEKWYKCDIDDTYPKTILENLDYYSKYIL